MVMLIRKVIRDIWKSKVQFISIFIMLFLGVFIFSGISSEWYGLQTYANKYLEESHFEDAVIYLEQGNDQDIETLAKVEGIEEIETRRVLPTTLLNDSNKSLDLHVLKENNISKLYVKEGIAFSNQEDGMWLDALFAKENGYQLNDTISIKIQNTSMEKKILGLVYSPEYVYGVQENQIVPNHQQYGFAFTSEASFPLVNTMSFNQVVVRFSTDVKKVTMQEALANKNPTIIFAKDHPSVSIIADEIKQHQSMGTVFAIAFLLIAILITITTLHRMLQSQKMQIGILKALGFSKRKLMYHFLCHTSIICLLGASLGYLCGSLFLPSLIYSFLEEMYVIADLQPIFLPYGWLIVIAIFVFCLTISMYICFRYINEKTVSILQGDRKIEYQGNSSRLYQWLPFRFQWNIRDILRNKIRSLMTIFGVFGCTALLFGAFGLYDTMTRITSFSFGDLQTYQYKIVLDTREKTQVDALMDTVNGQGVMESTITLTYNQQQKDMSLTVIEDTKYMRLATALNEYISLKQGVAISYTIAKSMDIDIGDVIQYRLSTNGPWHQEMVSTIIRTPTNQGITILKKDYLKSDEAYVPTAIIAQEITKEISNNPCVQSVLQQKDLMHSMDAMMEGMIMMIVVLVFGAIVLGSVVLYTLGVVTYTERYRELATLKVLGFQNKNIKKILIQQNIWLACIGLSIGMFGGYGLIVYMLSTLSDSMDVVLYIAPLTYIITGIGTLVLTWVISFCIARKVKKIDMVSALKINE